MIDRLTEGLLGRHVVERAEHDSHFRERSLAGFGRELRHAEIEDLDEIRVAVFFDEHDIFRLEVAVHDVPRVRSGEASRDLARDVQGAPNLERAPRDLGAQILSFDELEREVHRAVVELGEVHRLHDVRVLDVGSGGRLALEAREELGVLRVLGVHDLHGERLLHEHVLSAVNAPHPATTEQHLEAVALSENGPEQGVVRRSSFHRQVEGKSTGRFSPGARAGPLAEVEADGVRFYGAMRRRPLVLWLATVLAACGGKSRLVEGEQGAPSGGSGGSATGGRGGVPASCRIGSITEFPLADASRAGSRIVSGRDGDLWFTQGEVNAIGRITPTGSISEFPTPDPNGTPLDITTLPNGEIWFTKMSNKVGQVASDGTITEYSTPTLLSYPYGITTGPDGKVWFTELASYGIGRVEEDGTIAEFGVSTTLVVVPAGIVTGADGALWYTAAEGGKATIGRFATDGTRDYFRMPEPDSAPGWIVQGPDGNLWFTEWQGKAIGRMTTDWQLTEFPISNDGFDITVGPDQNLWFTERSAGILGCMTTSGELTEFPLQTGSFPSGITTGPDGNLWLTSRTQDEASIIRIGL